MIAILLALAVQCPDGSPPPCGRPARPTAPAANSVAVLYFDNLSRDTADAYLADGLTDEITTRLGQVSRLTVTSRTTMQRYRGSAAGDPIALARTLRVSHLVNGTIRRGPGRLRVGVELVRARDGVQVWTETYDRTDGDVLAIEEDVARAVATAIAGKLLPAERATLAARGTSNPAAHDHLMRGNFLLARRTQPDIVRALAEYDAAIRIDPDYGDAYAMTAFAYGIFRAWDWHLPGLSMDSVVERAVTSAQRALLLDSTSALAWTAMGMALAQRNVVTVEGAVPAYRRAIALDPRVAETHYQLGIALMLLGDTTDGIPEYLRAVELDPERPITLTWIGEAMLHGHRLGEARRWLDSAIAVAPTFPYGLSIRAGVRALQGDTSGAVSDAAAGLRASQGDTTLALALASFASAYAGDSVAARRFMRSVLAIPGAVHDEESVWIAGAQLHLGWRDEALTTLERVRPTAFFRYYLGYPFLDPLRDDERFMRVVASVRLQGAP